MEEQGEGEKLPLGLPEMRAEREALTEKEGEGDVLPLRVPPGTLRVTLGVMTLVPEGEREIEGQGVADSVALVQGEALCVAVAPWGESEALPVTDALADCVAEWLELLDTLTVPEAQGVALRVAVGVRDRAGEAVTEPLALSGGVGVPLPVKRALEEADTEDVLLWHALAEPL